MRSKQKNREGNSSTAFCLEQCVIATSPLASSQIDVNFKTYLIFGYVNKNTFHGYGTLIKLLIILALSILRNVI
jgi:hypothetical protein